LALSSRLGILDEEAVPMLNTQAMSDTLTELISRTASFPTSPKFAGHSNEDLLGQLSEGVRILSEMPLALASHGTTLACTKCGALGAPAYYLKRVHGYYAVLCFNNGEGCWEQSPRTPCTYVDQFQAQCPELAEWAVAYGNDALKERHVCALHVAAVLTDVSVHKVFPLQD
jgi:hypothetical protein